MSAEITKKRAADILHSMRDCRVVVLGDLMLEEFVWGDVTRISPEAPVPVVDIRRESFHLGGAAHVLALGECIGERLQRSQDDLDWLCSHKLGQIAPEIIAFKNAIVIVVV